MTLLLIGEFAETVYLGLALVLLVVYPVLLLVHGLSPGWFFRGAWPAIQLSFVSRSSVGTLPVTEECAEHGLGIPRAYAAFAVPLGATTKMDGCAAIYPAISAIFVAQFFGLPLHLSDYVLIAFVSVLGSAATAGLTGATVMLITHAMGAVAETAQRVVVMYAGRVVETGSTRDVISHPMHPYTHGLIASIPTPESRGRPLVPIPGMTPSLLNLPQGCAFRGRCPRASEACTAEPQPVEVRPSQWVRCWHAGAPEVQ